MRMTGPPGLPLAVAALIVLVVAGIPSLLRAPEPPASPPRRSAAAPETTPAPPPHEGADANPQSAGDAQPAADAPRGRSGELRAFREAIFQLPGPAIVRSPGIDGAEAEALAATRRAQRLCQACGREIPRAEPSMQAEGDRWHKRCFERRPTCGITGRPIPEGVATVELDGATFHAGDYERALKCLASGLPLGDGAEHVVNPRNGERVRVDCLDRTRQCTSCHDHVLTGVEVDGERFACAECARSYREQVRDDAAGLLAEVRAFLAAEGLKVPEVELVFAGFAEGLTAVRRGVCETTTVGGARRHRVLVLSHLHRDATAVVLAHELMHAVAAVAGAELAKSDEEGLCELAAWQYAERQGLPDYVRAGIENNADEEYREAFLRQRAKGQSLAAILRGQ